MTQLPPILESGRPDRTLGQASLAPLLTEWWEGLLWPRVLGAARLGLRPGRLGLAFVALLLAALLIKAGVAIDGRLVHRAAEWPWTGPASAEDPVLTWLWVTYVSVPKLLVLHYPVTTLVIGPVLLTAWLVMLGAISRITASEISLDAPVSWYEGLRFSVARWWALLGAVIGPLALAWVVGAVLTIGGVLARWPVVNVLFALLYGVALALAFFAVLVLVIYILGHNMLVPAVVCEGTDAIDAIQKAYRYVLARPARVVLYLVLATIGIAVVSAIVWLLVVWTIGFAARATGVLAADGYWMIWRPTAAIAEGLGRPGPAELPPTRFGVGAAIVNLWLLIPGLLFFAAVVSCSMAANTMIYLAMRRVCDGQDVAELWAPGMIAGSMRVSMEGRARAAAEAGFAPPPPVATPAEEADYQ